MDGLEPGTLVSALGKIGLITEVITGPETTAIWLHSPNHIFRGLAANNYSELIVVNQSLKPADRQALEKEIDAYIRQLHERIRLLEEFKEKAP